MGEIDAIRLATQPATVTSLSTDLRALGVPYGATVMVHSSLSSLGYVAGGAHAVVTALLEVLGTDGTLVMPTHSSDLSDPAAWRNPPVPDTWWQTIRDEMPPFDAELTPTVEMGAIVECFRHVGGVRRSNHPTVSATALGPNSDTVVDGHGLADGLGESSPQARLYDLDGWVLLLGVTHANNTSLHLAEYRAEFPNKRWETHGSPVRRDGRRSWTAYDELADGSEDFEQIGDAFAETGLERLGPIAAGRGRLSRVRDIVDFGVRWIETHRT